MIPIQTAQTMEWRMPLELAGFLVAGLAVGFVHFSLLWHHTRRLVRGSSTPRTVAVAIARFGFLAGALTLASLQGAPALLAMTTGLLGGRAFVMRRVGRVSE